jgi:hypothetical protein
VPRKRNTVLAVLQYFEEAELPLAQQALTLAQQILRRRSPQAAKRARPSRAKTPPTPPPADRSLN